MQRKAFYILVLGLPTVFWMASIGSATAMTVAELQRQLAQGEKLTVIDVRSPTLFGRGHIPEAINVPASVFGAKRLPPLGKVVIYGSGLGSDVTEVAAAWLASKPGIIIEVLEGGFAAWESAKGTTTRPAGVQPELLNYITYAELKKVYAQEAMLVDLRAPGSPARQIIPGDQKTPEAPLTDLAREFPGLRVTRSPFEVTAFSQAHKGSPPPLLVLIDGGEGAAEALARKLKANGIKRYAILAGGEMILARHGQAGLQRSSPESIPFKPKSSP